MRVECLKAVAQALGRELNQVESRDIEQRITRAARTLAQADPQAWMAKPAQVKLTEAGQKAAQELIGEARLKAERQALQIAANSRVAQHLNDMHARGIDGLDALDRMIAFHADGKTDGISIERWARGVQDDFLRQLIPVMEASNPKWFGLFENTEGVNAIVKEIHGEDSGNPVAKAGAKVWHEVSAAARERFNAAGGDIGKLDDWGMPHHHSQMKVAKAGQDAWVADILPKLKREKYVKEDGARMNDAELTEFLREAWVTIATGGANKMEPGQFAGNSMRANRGNASRSIHFKDAQSYLDYQQKFGDKSLYEVLVGHIENIAKDIALVETFGPNPDQAFRYFRDQAKQSAKIENPANSGKVDQRAIRTENLYNFVAGRTLPVASERLAKTFDTLRNWLTASRLGGAVVSSLTDEGTLHLVARTNNLPALRLFRNELAALNPANKMEERLANRAGLALNTMISSLNRFGQEGLGKSFSRKMANTVMRVQGLNAMTDARRRAFGVTMMDALGSVARDHATIGKLDPKDARLLKSKGVTDENFALWKKAQLENWGGNETMLTPDSIYRISDADVDAAIGSTSNRLNKLKSGAQAQVDALKSRDVEDRGWVTKREQNLNAWLSKTKARVETKLSKADDAAKAEINAALASIERLRENIDAISESWRKPIDENTPGIENQREVGFYGKAALKAKGVNEGRAREAIRNLNAEAARVRRSLESTRLAELKDFFAEFREKQAELAEFTKESGVRIARRQKVIDRINRDLDPAIARMRANAREQAATRLLAMVLEETDMAVIEPGAKERALMGANLQRGTWKGELTKSIFLFKSFPIAMLMRHWSRAFAQPTRGGRAAYIAALMASTTVLGAMAMQVKEVLAGRDPRNLNPFEDHGIRNWIKAMMQGGSLGIYGDFLFSEATQHGQSPIAAGLGPVAGLAEDVFKLTQGNVMQAAAGKETDAGAELVKFVKGNLPGGNLWYTKGAMDHMVWNQLAELFNPGSMSRVRRRSQDEFGQEYFWDPASPLPERAPNLAAVVGE